MKNIPKRDIFKVPEGYFESLPEEILDRSKNNIRKINYSRWAAAAVLIFSAALFIYKFESSNSLIEANSIAVDDQVELLIDQGEWNVEDVLSLSEDPNAVLDQVMAEEWGSYDVSDSELEEELWSY
ncbi:hypothetical protein IFO69_00750 [Echinicola sp. CAU 1574]|uniref:Uncharacterized protein n=1 Tax=Echinicola arenosa TaxID=2774144 RepID=A0ABR9AI22_9BACT|nr:hypothetical protein [Echinicola arenosa]MBD8487264.1 hypothetical protein [Echinicola arenosa]